MRRLVLEPRETNSILVPFQVAVLALLLTALCGAILFAIYDVNPLKGLHAVFVEPLQSTYGIGEVLLKMAPLLLIAQGLAIGFRAQVWNIGAEGQLILGAIAASVLAIQFDGTSSPLLLPAMVLAGMVAGMAWAGIAAFLRTQFNANEILVTFMLTSVALQLLYYLVTGPLKDPMGFNFPQSISFGSSAKFDIIIETTRANASLYIGLFVTALATIFVRFSFANYKLSVGGLAPGAAFYAGFSSKRAIWVALLVSGGAAGLAGVGEVAGPLGQLQRNISPGYGYAGIIVAVLGGLHPIGILFAAAIMALVYVGGDFALLSVGVPDAVTEILQGILLISYLACSLLLTMRMRWVREGVV
ncbi:ABC transporter permease [Algirhabdus cladophorae]|uniref:ABC transporter permease n=1 Tax=Algirhabdus cladophorae TaxID=3377108 RepID=UPI003B84750D